MKENRKRLAKHFKDLGQKDHPYVQEFYKKGSKNNDQQNDDQDDQQNNDQGDHQ